MRHTDDPVSSSFPSRGGSGYRICPVCSRGFAGKPAKQRTCSTKCSKEWARSQKPKFKPPRFDVIEGRLPAIYDSDNLDWQDSSWRERGEYWDSVVKATRETDRSAPLSIAGHGALVRVDGNMLVVRDGFTHHPHRRVEWRFHPRDAALPERIVLLSCDGAISVPALTWLARQRVPVLLLDARGNITATFSGDVGGNIDLEARAKLHKLDTARAVEIAKNLIAAKLAGQARVAQSLSDGFDGVIVVGKIRREKQALVLATTIEDIRLAEARAAVAYFRLWTKLPMRWKGLSARPVAAEWLHVGMRGSAIGNSNRNATHPAHAMLNYGYAILQSQISIACARAGLDLTAGILHAQRPGRPALTLDLMEGLRPLVDEKIVAFLRSHVFARVDFLIGDDGVVRLHPQLARAVAMLRMGNDVVEQSISGFLGELRQQNDSHLIDNRH